VLGLVQQFLKQDIMEDMNLKKAVGLLI